MSNLNSLSPDCAWPLYGRDGIRALEALLQARSPEPLMQQAGLATARLALATAPHAQHIWVAAGPGNNGGDGIEAALHLHQWGKSVRVSMTGRYDQLPTDARAALQSALNAGVPFSDKLPRDGLTSLGSQDLIIDALLGIGATRRLQDTMIPWVRAINQSHAAVLAVDVPTGLDADSGLFLGHSPIIHCVRADHTLSFIAAKPGLFMGHGRDVCGQIWLADLGWTTGAAGPEPSAWLNPRTQPQQKSHASHKGSHGDVAVIGGHADGHGMGMTGAAVLAATAALHAGAGRVLLSLLSGQGSDTAAPDLMQRNWQSLDLERLHVACGCGGGEAVKTALPAVLRRSMQLVLDADGLNAVSQDRELQSWLRQRAPGQSTVITPHPLEAARLLNTSTNEVQSDRLKAAQSLVNLFLCTVVLKGSGTVIASPGQTPRINPTGNGRLATAGTGDVLAGLIAARMAQGLSPFEAACTAVAQHGQSSNDWPESQALTASRLAISLV
jgi:hydroxyethylthiazole kinase-like uncharacterized protein yjeF